MFLLASLFLLSFVFLVASSIHFLPLRLQHIRSDRQWNTHRQLLQNPEVRRILVQNVPSVDILKESTVSFQKQYSVAVDIGTPYRTYDLIVDTGSTDLWVQSIDCEDCAGEHPFPRYNASLSTSFQSGCQWHKNPCIATVSYGSGTMKALLGTERVRINDFEFPVPVEIGLAYSEDHDIVEILEGSGILGLGFDGAASYTIPSVISYMDFFALELNNDDGKLTINSVLPEYDNSSWITLPLEKYVGAYTFWMVGLPKVTINSKDICGGKYHRCQAVIDTGTGLIAVPKNIWNRLSDILEGSGCYNNLSDDGLFFCPRASVPDIFLTFGTDYGYELILRKEDIIIDALSPSIVVLGFILSPLEDDIWILGNLFITRFYIKYDVKKREISFTDVATSTQAYLSYTRSEIDSKDKPSYLGRLLDADTIELSIVCTILGVSLIITLSIIHRYRQKKKSIEEMQEKDADSEANLRCLLHRDDETDIFSDPETAYFAADVMKSPKINK